MGAPKEENLFKASVAGDKNLIYTTLQHEMNMARTGPKEAPNSCMYQWIGYCFDCCSKDNIWVVAFTGPEMKVAALIPLISKPTIILSFSI